VVMFALSREINCVVKQALWNNRYFGGVVREVGYVSNADADRLVDDCAAVLAKGESLLVFPEGTRTEPDMPIHFQRGAARIALRAGCEIVPVIFHCYPAVWGKGFRISHIARCQFHIRVEVKSPLRVTDLGVTEPEEARAARQLTRNLETYFLREITSYERPASGNKATHHRIFESGRSET
jgi:1-acyl-sn-glycerol-3-phosphate acyltransferase